MKDPTTTLTMNNNTTLTKVTYEMNGNTENKPRFSELPIDERKEMYNTLEKRGSLETAFPVICQPRDGLAFRSSPNSPTPINTDLGNERMFRLLRHQKRQRDPTHHIKFLCRKDDNIDVRKLLYMIRTQLGEKLDACQGLYLFVENKNVLVSGSQSMMKLYDTYKNEDGFLYLTFDVESTFG
jgi:hypothetical protein